MKRKGKVTVMIVIALMLLFQALPVMAAYSVKTAKCPSCPHRVSSYGVDEMFSTIDYYVTAGNRCSVCNQIVTNGTKHHYYTSVDLYYFVCSDPCCNNKPFSSRKFTKRFENSTPRGHEVIVL